MSKETYMGEKSIITNARRAKDILYGKGGKSTQSHNENGQKTPTSKTKNVSRELRRNILPNRTTANTKKHRTAENKTTHDLYQLGKDGKIERRGTIYQAQAKHGAIKPHPR